ncbi:MAG: hypothetical protein ABW360_16620 [Phenylobacterium sp.]
MDEFDNHPGGLTQGERLLLCAVRMLAAENGCNSLRPSFEHACGCSGRQAFGALEVFVQQLRLHSQRRIAVTPPAVRGPTPDEALMLEAFACAQADDYRGLDDRLAELTGGLTPSALGAAACLVADAFAMNGLVLRSPVGLAPPARSEARRSWA